MARSFGLCRAGGLNMTFEIPSVIAARITVRHLDDGTFDIVLAARVPHSRAYDQGCEPVIRDSSSPGAGAYVGRDIVEILERVTGAIPPDQPFQPPRVAEEE